MILRFTHAAVADAAALVLGALGCGLIALGRWLANDDDTLADLGNYPPQEGNQ